VGGASNPSAGQIINFIRGHAGQEITIEWKRGDQAMSGRVTPSQEGRIGITIGSIYTGPVKRVDYTMPQALFAGVGDIGGAVVMFVKSIGWVIAGKVAFKNAVGGPIMIAQLATQSAASGLGTFLGFMGLLSVSLAIINILPFPALDGGHLVFVIYERIFRREIPAKVKIIFQQVGFGLLLLLMAFVIYNDITRF
jgi:regulator of sigma E protease